MEKSFNNLFQFDGNFYSLHRQLIKVKQPLQIKEETNYQKKVGKNLASFLDQKTYEQKTLSQNEINLWVTELNQDVAQRDTHQLYSLIHPLSSDKFILNFYNVQFNLIDKIKSSLKLTPLKNSPTKINLANFNQNYCFKLYYPSEICPVKIFKYLPSVEKRIKALAEDIVGNDWLTTFPENQWQNYLWKMLEYLKSPAGIKAIEEKQKELSKMKFITKVNQLK